MLRSAGNIAILKSEVMKKTILLLDDKESIAKVVAVYLSGEYDVVYFDNALKGIQWLQEGNKPDLIISDIRMPVMRGDEFLEYVKNNELFKSFPVIILSSEESTSERIRLLEVGASDYIVKPFNPMELKIMSGGQILLHGLQIHAVLVGQLLHLGVHLVVGGLQMHADGTD